MLKKLSIVGGTVALCGCSSIPSIMPGMQNLNIAAVRKSPGINNLHVEPILVAITPDLIADQHVSTYYYHIAPADVLHITVWQHPEFQAEIQVPNSSSPAAQGSAGAPGYLVDSNGRIYFPLVGYVRVVGKTVDEVRKEITKRLEKYVPNPQVNVRVGDFRGQKIYVLGEVMKSGFLPITDQTLTLADALSLSGWMDPKAADTSHIYVIRGDFTHPTIFWLDAKTPDRLLLAEHFSLKPQDVLYVSTAGMTQLNRVLEQLLPIVQTVWFTQSVVNNS